MDELVRKVAALGFPGVVAVVIIGGASISMGPPTMMMLATLGGPVGFLGGCAAFGMAALITDTVTKYGIEAVLVNIYRFRVKVIGEESNMLLREVDKLPISNKLRLTVKNVLE